MNKYQTIHETPVRTIMNIIDLVDGLNANDIFDATKRSPYASTSIAKITSDLTLVFPCMCTNTIHLDTAMMLSKAIERRCVVMLQILFSAFQVTDADSAKEFINRFHSNIKIGGKATVDDFIALADSIGESGGIEVNHRKLAALSRDFRENCFFVFKEDVSDTSIANQYNKANHRRLLYEAKPQKPKKPPIITSANPLVVDIPDGAGGVAQVIIRSEDEYERLQREYRMSGEAFKAQAAADAYNRMETLNRQADDKYELDMAHARSREEREVGKYLMDLMAYTDKGRLTSAQIAQVEKQTEMIQLQIDQMKSPEAREKAQLELQRLRAEIEKNNVGRLKDMSDIRKNNADFFQKQILSSDIKKANELVPTTMVMSFTHVDKESGRATKVEDVVIGVKCRMVFVDSMDIINHILTKLDDKEFVFNLIRATTREISFFRDFIFAIDKAKIEALANSKRGSSDPMWKVLERRSLMSRANRFIGRGNNCNAITHLVVSQEEVDYVRKNMGKNIDSPKAINAIMDAYNFMSINIVDESLELCKFMFDTGENQWETLSFSSLEKEQNNGDYKKIVNLMSKIS